MSFNEVFVEQKTNIFSETVIVHRKCDTVATPVQMSQDKSLWTG